MSDLSRDLDELYDWAEVDARTGPRPRTRPATTRRGSVALTAALLAVGDVLLAERRREPVVEESPDPGLDPALPVIVHLVPGWPSRSSAVVR